MATLQSQQKKQSDIHPTKGSLPLMSVIVPFKNT